MYMNVFLFNKSFSKITKMMPNKRTMKLSRSQQSQSASQTEKATALDDSMDDFIMTRPLRAERKVAKTSTYFKSSNELPAASNKKEQLLEIDIPAGSSVQKPNYSMLVLQCPLCPKTFSTAEQKEKHMVKCAKDQKVDDKTLLAAVDLQERQNAERLSIGLPPVKKAIQTRVTRRAKANDPSDLSLALALSESLQAAKEDARQKEEELLLKENLAEVIPELREEKAVASSWAEVFQRAPDVPAPKVKRKNRAAAKKEPKQYILALRSQAERERLIAERAAAVVSPVQENVVKSAAFLHREPISDYIKQYIKEYSPLWRCAALNDTTPVEVYYVSALCQVLSPPKKKVGYTIMPFHVSQLPGRDLSQMNATKLSNTQAILEELAFGAEGGFLDEPSMQEDCNPLSIPSKLAENWSMFIDNPLMSDVTVVTSSKEIRAHRLVFAARCPHLIDSLEACSKLQGNFVLDWTEYPASAVLKVLGYIYAGRYDHDEAEALEVYRIARRYRLAELLELLPQQFGQYSFHSLDDDHKGMETSKSSSSSRRKMDSSLSDEPAEVLESLYESKESPLKTATKPISSYVSPEKQMDISYNTSPQCRDQSSLANYSAVADDLADTIPYTNIRTPPEITISQEETVPVSPDMFQETLSESDEEVSPTKSMKSYCSEVIDLTQEDSSDRSASPLGGSCERDSLSEDEFSQQKTAPPTAEKVQVSMVECSMLSRPRTATQTNKSDVSMVECSMVKSNSPIASCSNAFSNSFANHSIPQWNYDHFDIESCPADITTPSAHKASQPSKLLSMADEFPDELESIFGRTIDFEQSPGVQPVPRVSEPADFNTPEAPRLAKKRKIDVTPLPDYQTMETPLLKQQLDKYGLKPLKRHNAVKLLHHIYEELHPMVTDSESSFQESPERRISEKSPLKSIPSSQDESENSQEDEENMYVMELDREIGCSQIGNTQRTVPIKTQLKEFIQKRPDIYKSVLAYEPISFEYLYKEIRKDGVRCKAQDLLDWLDEECITCRMKTRNRNGASGSPTKTTASPAKKPAPKSRRVAKKLIT